MNANGNSDAFTLANVRSRASKPWRGERTREQPAEGAAFRHGLPAGAIGPVRDGWRGRGGHRRGLNYSPMLYAPVVVAQAQPRKPIPPASKRARVEGRSQNKGSAIPAQYSIPNKCPQWRVRPPLVDIGAEWVQAVCRSSTFCYTPTTNKQEPAESQQCRGEEC